MQKLSTSLTKAFATSLSQSLFRNSSRMKISKKSGKLLVSFLFHILRKIIIVIKFFSKEHPCGKCEHHAISIKCDTHRCPLGKCLETHQLCDNSIECHDRSDEQEEICLHVKKGDRPCGKDEFHCRNGKCIKKSMFCNHVNDCGDKSDEPSECTCFSYLKATAPKKICDGTR